MIMISPRWSTPRSTPSRPAPALYSSPSSPLRNCSSKTPPTERSLPATMYVYCLPPLPALLLTLRHTATQRSTPHHRYRGPARDAATQSSTRSAIFPNQRRRYVRYQRPATAQSRARMGNERVRPRNGRSRGRGRRNSRRTRFRRMAILQEGSCRRSGEEGQGQGE